MNIIKIHDRLFEPFILNDQIQKRVKLIAEEISKEYEYKNPLFLAVLNGAFMLAADLLREIQFQSEISFVKISSYQGTKSTDSIKELIGFTESLTDRDVIIIEDIVDTGLSMKHILEQVHAHKPASVKVATLLLKKAALKHPVQTDYIGFEIENKFVVGYGLDYDGVGRNLPHIYVERSA
ncbi:hypoxanthine phosphoribosyltransferase [Bacteroidetes bacterium UKL13-3]|jgi:hypoxanthine phosphoribosyltransferase|nr:hypoxanthine phosphoribosyltransferase [Bacteroidetes bacterium UKL13-3]HCP94178.1 hypoxanthine phosphoribosyltransferase [Bacteroidota bacterium]